MERYVAELHPECGPGEVWWILDTCTDQYTSWSLSSQAEAEAIAGAMNRGEMNG